MNRQEKSYRNINKIGEILSGIAWGPFGDMYIKGDCEG